MQIKQFPIQKANKLPKAALMTQAQQKHLLSRIPSRYDTKSHTSQPEPKQVQLARGIALKAERIIAKWEKRNRALSEAHDKYIAKLKTAAQEAIYFGTPTQALKLVRQLEGMKK